MVGSGSGTVPTDCGSGGGTDPVDTGDPGGGSDTCGDGVLDEGEEYDPAPGPYTTIVVDDETCRWDFSSVRQLYCNGSCSWAGDSDCDAADADIFCKLLTLFQYSSINYPIPGCIKKLNSCFYRITFLN